MFIIFCDVIEVGEGSSLDVIEEVFVKNDKEYGVEDLEKLMYEMVSM